MLNNNYDIQAIQKYLQNNLSNDERYAFERKMEADSFLMDAVEGFGNISKKEISNILDSINKKLRTVTNKIVQLSG